MVCAMCAPAPLPPALAASNLVALRSFVFRELRGPKLEARFVQQEPYLRALARVQRDQPRAAGPQGPYIPAPRPTCAGEPEPQGEEEAAAAAAAAAEEEEALAQLRVAV